MSKSSFLIFILLMLFGIDYILAEGYSVQGKIVNSSKSPLPWIHIKLVNKTDTTKTFNATTNTDGIFFFANIPPQNYRLEASEVGKKTIKISIQVLKSDLDLGSQIMTELPI